MELLFVSSRSASVLLDPEGLYEAREKRMLRLAGLPPMPDWKDALKEFCALEFGAEL